MRPNRSRFSRRTEAISPRFQVADRRSDDQARRAGAALAARAARVRNLALSEHRVAVATPPYPQLKWSTKAVSSATWRRFGSDLDGQDRSHLALSDQPSGQGRVEQPGERAPGADQSVAPGLDRNLPGRAVEAQSRRDDDGHGEKEKRPDHHGQRHCAAPALRPAPGRRSGPPHGAVRATVLERRKLNRMSRAVIGFVPISTPP